MNRNGRTHKWRMGGAMKVEMQRRMTRTIMTRTIMWRLMSIVGLIALASACAHKAPAPSVASDAAVAAALAPTQPPIPGPTYRIGAGDELHVRFLYQPDMSEQLPVRPDGRISLGATGEITAVGLTPVELEKVIIERSSARLRDPEVTVVVTKVGEQRVYVGGEVGRP